MRDIGDPFDVAAFQVVHHPRRPKRLRCSTARPPRPAQARLRSISKTSRNSVELLLAGQAALTQLRRIGRGEPRGGGQLTREEIQPLWDAWRFWRREPERSQRVIRLLTANWLAYHDLPSQNRPKPDPKVTAFDIYPLGPRSTAKARTSPEALERWFDSASDARNAPLSGCNRSPSLGANQTTRSCSCCWLQAVPPGPRNRSADTRGADRSLPRTPARAIVLGKRLI